MNDAPIETGHFRLRRRILELLYASFQDVPFADVELSQIEESCETTTKELNWNIVYLEKCGYVDLNKSTECYPYAAFAASLTAAGIDLVENPAAFHSRFPVGE